MNENIIPVNSEALSRALVAVVGEQTATAVTQAYQAIDAAMNYGFQQGLAKVEERLKQAAEEYVAALERTDKAAYDHGFQESHAQAVEDAEQVAFDDGYIEGATDARTRPEEADDYIAYLCSLDLPEVDNYDDQADLDGFDGTYDWRDQFDC
jgi:uncharacterized protein YecT (DUF1311 family)